MGVDCRCTDLDCYWRRWDGAGLKRRFWSSLFRWKSVEVFSKECVICLVLVGPGERFCLSQSEEEEATQVRLWMNLLQSKTYTRSSLLGRKQWVKSRPFSSLERLSVNPSQYLLPGCVRRLRGSLEVKAVRDATSDYCIETNKGWRIS